MLQQLYVSATCTTNENAGFFAMKEIIANPPQIDQQIREATPLTGRCVSPANPSPLLSRSRHELLRRCGLNKFYRFAQTLVLLKRLLKSLADTIRKIIPVHFHFINGRTNEAVSFQGVF